MKIHIFMGLKGDQGSKSDEWVGEELELGLEDMVLF